MATLDDSQVAAIANMSGLRRLTIEWIMDWEMGTVRELQRLRPELEKA